jgi:ubiquitin C-terminal hydrolase
MELKVIKVPSPSASAQTSPALEAGQGPAPPSGTEAMPKSSLKTLKLRVARSVQINEECWTDGDVLPLDLTGRSTDSSSGSSSGDDSPDAALAVTLTRDQEALQPLMLPSDSGSIPPVPASQVVFGLHPSPLTASYPSSDPVIAPAISDATPPSDKWESVFEGEGEGILLDLLCSDEGETAHIDSATSGRLNGNLTTIAKTGDDMNVVRTGDKSNDQSGSKNLDSLSGPELPPASSGRNTGGVGVGTHLADRGINDASVVGIGRDDDQMRMARISYLGWPERCDAWIALDSCLIAKLDSESQGRRGDSPVREEVVFLSSSSAIGLANVSLEDMQTEALRSERPFTLAKSLRNYSTYSPNLVEVVNCFGASQGFESLLNVMCIARKEVESRMASSPEANSQSHTTPVSVSAPLACSIIVAIGGLHRVLSTPFLQYLEHKQLFSTFAFLLRNMSMKEVRETPIEAVEAALTAMEGLSLAYSTLETATATSAPTSHHRCEVAQLLYDIAVRYLDCPYLNRRLGGLKMLIDLFKRAQSSEDYPSGMNVVRTTFAGVESVSYRVVHMLPHHTVRSLCQALASSGFLSSIFRGERAHESLMMRSGDILRTMLQQGCVDNSVLTAVWEAGFQQREAAAMTTLTEAVAVMEAPSLSFLLLSAVGIVEPAAATVHVVDVLSAIAKRCRTLVMTAPPKPQLPISDIALSGAGKEVENFHNGSRPAVNAAGDDAIDLHNQVLRKLWNWAADCSGVTDQVAVRCLLKLIAAVSVVGGTPNEDSLPERSLPWGRQWLRSKNLVLCALEALRENKSVVPAVRVLQAFICSWPVRSESNANNAALNQLSDMALPFSSPTRASVAEYLEATFGIFDIIALSVAKFKGLFNDSVKSIASEQTVKPSDAAHCDTSTSTSAVITALSDELQAVLNDVMVGGSRVGYKEQLMRSLDFLHHFLRCSDNLVLSEGVIKSLWEHVACNAVTTEEVNLIVNFLSRLILRAPVTAPPLGPKAPATDGLQSCMPCAVQDGEAKVLLPYSSLPFSIPSPPSPHPSPNPCPKRKSVCSAGAIEWVFRGLLSDKWFIQCPFFSLNAFSCVEKFFRWLNAEAGLIVDAKVQPFTIVGPPSSLIGIGVFSDIIISCKLDPVASQAATFLTSLPSCLAPALVEAGELVSLRQLLLQKCNDQLAHAVQCAVDPRALSRLLMLLSALLEESSQDGRPHGSLGRGVEVALYISANKMKERSGPLVMYSNDTIGDLFYEISRIMDKSISKLKVFRLAKDITTLDETKTLGQMKFGAAGSEQIMVTERIIITPAPAALLKPCETLLPSEGSTAMECSSSSSGESRSSLSTAVLQQLTGGFISTSTSTSTVTSKKAAIATVQPESLSSSSEQLDMLFALLESSQRFLVDEIWGLISRLPSSRSLMTSWLNLAAPSVADLLLSQSSSAVSKGTACKGVSGGTTSAARLLYNLQIIEALLQPSSNSGARARHTASGAAATAPAVSYLEKRGNSVPVPAPVQAHCLRGYEYLDQQLVLDWHTRFLSKGGFEAVCAVFELLSSFFEPLSPHVSGESRAGSSPRLVLQILEVAVRLSRSLLVRATAAALESRGDKGTLLLFLRNLEACRGISPAALSTMSIAAPPLSSSPSSSFIGPLPPPPPYPAAVKACSPSEMQQDPIIEMTSEAPALTAQVNDAKEAEVLLARECCRAVNGQCQTLLTERLKDINLKGMQHTSLSLMVCVRRFSNEDIFREDASDWTAKAAMRARRRVLFTVLDGLFAVWTAAAVTQPSILSSLSAAEMDSQAQIDVDSDHHSFSMQTLLTRLLLGVEEGHRERVRESSEEMGALVAKWSSEELQQLVAFSPALLGGPLPCPSEHLRRCLLDAFLALRPPLVTTSRSAFSLSTASFSSEKSVKELFSLALSLLGGPKVVTSATAPSAPHMAPLLSPQQRMELSIAIFDELKTASRCYLRPTQAMLDAPSDSSQDLTVHSESVGDTLNILHSLVTEHSSPTSTARESGGCLDVLCVLYEQRGIIAFLLVECLGLVPVTSDSVPRTLCNDDQSRTAAYAILTSLCYWRPSIVYEVLRHLEPVFRSVPPLSVWDYKPERDVRSSTGFVGLRNKGCTCYMNSLLQVLYMVPEVREGILSTQTAPNASEAASSNDIVLQLQRLFFNLKYGEKKAFSPDDWVFAYKDESGLLPVNVSQQQDAQEFLQVLCERLSAQDSQGQGQGASCTPVAGSRGTDAGSSTSASATASTGSRVSLVGELLKSSFGGKICNQMLLESQAESPKGDRKEKEEKKKVSSGVREQEDPFVCLSLQVKDAKGLEHSLAQFVEGEKIEDYQWDDDGPRVTISKRQCISQLSDTLIFHLKRFELNFDTFRREKVNDSFSFPMYLNMLPYTKEGLTPTHLVDPSLAGGGGEGEAARSNAYYQYELTGVVVHSGTTDSGHYYAYIKDRGDDSTLNTDNHDRQSTSSPTASSFQQLSSSQNSSNSNPSKNPEKRADRDRDRKTYRWLEFNDSEVSEFPESRLEAECFGGTTKSYDYSVSTISEVETVNPKSAYMLVYRRVRTLALRPPPAPIVATPLTSTQSAPGPVTDRSAEDVVTLIKRENARHTMMLRLADQVNLSTVGVLLKRVVEAHPYTYPYPYAYSRSAIPAEGQRQSDEGPLSVSQPHSVSVLPMDIQLGLVWVTMDFISHCSFNGTASTIFDVISDSLLCSISQHLSLEAQLLSSIVTSGSANEEWKYDSMQTADTSGTDDSSGHDTASMSAAESDSSGHQLVPESSGRGLEEYNGKEKERECSTKPSKKARLVSGSAAADRDRADNASPVCSGLASVSVSGLGPAPDTPSDLQALAGGIAKKIAAKESFNDVISLLYCPDKPTRMSFAKLLLSGFQLLSYADGDAAYTTESEEVREDLLNSDFALKSSVSVQDSAVDRKLLTVSESSDLISALGDDDDDIALAIKLSMEGCPRPSGIDDGDYDSYDTAADIPLAVAVPIPADGQGQGLLKAADSEIKVVTALEKDQDRDGDEDVVEMSYPTADFESTQLPVAATATAVAHSSPSTAGVSVSAGTDTALCVGMQVEMEVQDPDTSFGQVAGAVLVQATPLPASARFLLELTRDGRLQLLAENWRRSDAMTWLLFSICQLGSSVNANSPLNSPSPCLSSSAHKVFLMKRQLIPQLVALFTGDSSLVVGSTVHGPRKTAPSSYVVVGPPSTRGGAPPIATRNIPDWTDLLDCLVALVTSCRTDAMDCWTNEQFTSYSSALTVDSPKLDWVSGLSATSRTLYSIALKQCRYSAQTTALILHLSQNCISFSDMISEVLLEALFQCSAETTSHVFTVMEAFLTIDDGLVGHRALSMFSGETSPLCMLKGIQDQAPKRRLVCVCISSLMSLLQKVPSVFRTLTVPASIIQTWAPWMLKFSFIFMNDCLKESSSAAALKSSYAPAPVHAESVGSSVPAPTVEKGNID